jgi:uncharacterized protein
VHGERLGPAVLHETHVSVVVEIGDRVYKLKKPVRLDFLDFRSREAREAVCHREVDLNRRLAPDVYLGVADITGPDGRVCDHLVVMRRLPASRRLSTLVRAGADVGECVRSVARVIAAFHERATTSPEIARAGHVDRVRANWDTGFETMAPFLGRGLDQPSVSRARALVHEYLAGRVPLFERRVRDGKIRDGHGDLQCEDTFCLDDGPRILDCIEFDDGLRHGDVVSDVAFLAMDLERCGSSKLAYRLFDWYHEFSGDTPPRSLVDHYIAYRAQVRCKVACLRSKQGDRDAPSEAQRLLTIMSAHLERARVPLVLVGGLPGTGKSTLAEGLATELGYGVLRSDEVRKELLGFGHTERIGHGVGVGPYDDATTERTYAELLRRASALLSLGEPVVIDASWSDARRRADAAAVARQTSSALVELRCMAPTAVAEARLVARAQGGADPSDASVEVARAMAARAAPWPEAVSVPTDTEVADVQERAAAAVRQAMVSLPAPTVRRRKGQERQW